MPPGGRPRAAGTSRSDERMTGRPPRLSRPRRRRLRDLGEELVVALRGADLVDEEFQALALLERVEHAPQLPHLLELLTVEQQLLVASTRRLDVDRRVDAPFREVTVEAQLHVAG